MIQKRVQRFYVIAAGGPVQGRLPMRKADYPRVHVGIFRYQVVIEFFDVLKWKAMRYCSGHY